MLTNNIRHANIIWLSQKATKRKCRNGGSGQEERQKVFPRKFHKILKQKPQKKKKFLTDRKRYDRISELSEQNSKTAP